MGTGKVLSGKLSHKGHLPSQEEEAPSFTQHAPLPFPYFRPVHDEPKSGASILLFILLETLLSETTLAGTQKHGSHRGLDLKERTGMRLLALVSGMTPSSSRTTH